VSKTLLVILSILVTLLQAKLWWGDGSIPRVVQLSRNLEQEVKVTQALRDRNQQLSAEVHDLKTALDAVEERARSELGMLKEGEMYYQFVEPETHSKQ